MPRWDLMSHLRKRNMPMSISKHCPPPPPTCTPELLCKLPFLHLDLSGSAWHLFIYFACPCSLEAVFPLLIFRSPFVDRSY